MSKRTTNLIAVLFLAWNPAPARQEWQTCGTHPERTREELALHRQSMRSRGVNLRSRAATQVRSANRDIGEIAIIEDSDGVVARRNLFNLDRKTVLFSPVHPSGSQYRFSVSDGGWDESAAAGGLAIDGLGDDDAREITIPFSFPFYGKSYTKLFLNSDGNITFGRSDTAIAERSLGRMTSGAPRISGLFRDLDPSRAPNGVRVLSQTNRVVISWINIPDYAAFGSGPPNTFQIRMHSDGRIELSYQGVATMSGVVGIAPGNLEGSTAVVSLNAGSSQTFTGAVVERFSGAEEVDIVLAAQKFYETHDDGYDYLAIFNSLGIPASAGAVAFEVTVRSDRLGIGDPPSDNGLEFGSARRLQAVLNLGPLSQYPRDPDGIVPSRSLSRDTPLTIIGHEAGHLFLAFASVREPGNPTARPMLGRQSAHWSFTFNSEASLLEGNRIRDNGAGSTPRFTTVGTVEGYAPLDQYLMGFRAPEEVTPTFLVTEATTGPSNRQPQTGISFDGNRRDIRIDELIGAEGRRTPDHTVAQRRFRMAFILVTGGGVEPVPEQISQIDTYRQRFEEFFHQASGRRAYADSTLRRSLLLSMAPAAGVVAGRTTRAAVSVSRPVETPLTVFLRRQNAVTEIPSSVVIAAGQAQTSFEVRGLRAGVEELAAESSDTRFASGFARIQVSEGPDKLRLIVVSGDRQQAISGTALPDPIVFRVADENNLPYPGIDVSATVTAGGSVEPGTGITDRDGLVRFRWVPGSGQLHDLRATLTGSALPATVVTALGRPVLESRAVVNAASFSPGLSPGSLATLFGLNLTGGNNGTSEPPWRDQIAGVQVRVNGISAPLLFVSDRQINLQAPASLASGTAEIVVISGSGSSQQQTAPVQVPVKAFDPGIFIVDTATGLGAVLAAGTGQLTTQRPVSAGDIIEIYATGLGTLRPSSAFPALLETVTAPGVLIGGRSAEVLFSGQAPGFPGLYQINARVPDGLAAGTQRLTVEIAATTSNQAVIMMR